MLNSVCGGKSTVLTVLPLTEPMLQKHRSLTVICKNIFVSFSPCPGVSGNICRVTGGVLGIHWSSIITLGWHSLADGRAGATCWESCCLEPSCGAVWSLGGRCVLLRCTREQGCPVAYLPQPHQESLGLLQLLSKVKRNNI